MGGKADAPPPPDYTPIAKASEKSAELSYKMSQEQLAWAKEQYADTSGLAKQVVNSAMKTQDANAAAAASDRARYERVYQPLEDNLVSDARDYASGARKDLEMGRAAAQVGNQFGQQRQAALQNLEAFGVDPTSTRYAALDIATRSAQAGAQAAASNQAAVNAEATGRALRSEAINVGRGYPGQIAQAYGVSLQGGNQAMNSALSNVASGANTMGTGTQWQGLGNQALGVWGNTLNMGYQNQLAQFQANQQSSSGWGSALGLLGGLATTFMEDGGAVPDMPQGGQGQAVPVEASPSRGAAIDDVPARLSPGEFVVPDDVVSWVGEKHMQDLIMKSRKEREGAPAKPQVRSAPPADPTFVSSGAQQAIPMG